MQQFSKEVSVKWLKYEFPIFKLTDWGVPMSYNEESMLEILLENYSFLDPNLDIKWKVEPEAKFTLSPSNAQLFFEKGAIAANKPYKVTVTISNTLSTKSQTTKVHEFTSFLAPQPGQVVLEPNSGIRS